MRADALSIRQDQLCMQLDLLRDLINQLILGTSGDNITFTFQWTQPT
jgi:hypothetical protein